jgi:DNA (cytosine-5)-methyltransferase 1
VAPSERLPELLARGDASKGGRIGVLTVGSLFSGIGGLDLGLERAGMRVLWQCESDPYCRAVLRKHWPAIPCYEDVKTLLADADEERRPERRLSARQGGSGLPDTTGSGGSGASAIPQGCEWVDVLCGGFPCQPVSLAGARRGAADERWLWPEFARLIRLLRPRYALMENVPGLLVGGGMAEVLGDLAACGYDAEWDCIPAAAVGAPLLRYRIFIVAYASSSGRTPLNGQRGESPSVGEATSTNTRSGSMADPNSSRWNGRTGELWTRWRRQPPDNDWWLTEPDVGRVAHGVPSRVDRLRALGNAVVPQVAEAVGRMIVAHAEVAA